jgi:hypothetical protein
MSAVPRSESRRVPFLGAIVSALVISRWLNRLVGIRAVWDNEKHRLSRDHPLNTLLCLTFIDASMFPLATPRVASGHPV